MSDPSHAVAGKALDAALASQSPLSQQRCLEIARAVVALLDEAWRRDHVSYPPVSLETIVIGDDGVVALLDPKPGPSATERDWRTDLHGLGAAMRQALTGRDPDDDLRPLTAAVPDLHPRLGQVIERLLAGQTAAGYENLATALADLDQAGRALGETVPLPATPTASPRRPLADEVAASNRLARLLLRSLGGTVIVLAIIVFVAARFGERELPPAPPPATGDVVPAVTSAGDRSGSVAILALLPDPTGPDAGEETVTLVNRSAVAVELAGWELRDEANQSHPLLGSLAAGAQLAVTLRATTVRLNQGGDTVMLFDAAGQMVDRVEYAAADVRRGVELRFE